MERSPDEHGGGRLQEHLIGYLPLPSQRRFHESKARFKGFSGPIGSGKSQALCQEAIRLAYVNPRCTGLIGAPTYPMLRDATRQALLQVLEENEIPYELHKSEGYVELKHTRSRILLRSLDEYERVRGTNLAWFGIDELTYCKEEAWLRLEGRLREPNAKQHCGFAVWTPKGRDWVHRRFIGSQSDEYEVIRAQPQENRHILEVDPAFYDRLKRTYSDAFYRQEVLGEYLFTNEKRVYDTFDARRHVRDLKPDDQRPLLWSLDFNVSPFCSVICQRKDNNIYVVDEVVLQRGNSVEIAEKMNMKYGSECRQNYALAIYGDASGHSAQTNGPSNYKQIQAVMSQGGWTQVNVRAGRSNPPVSDRVHLLRSLLCNAEGEQRIWIDPRCHSLIADLEQVQYHDDGVRIDKSSDPKRTHSSDALGYLLWAEFGTRAKIGEGGDVPQGVMVI